MTIIISNEIRQRKKIRRHKSFIYYLRAYVKCEIRALVCFWFCFLLISCRYSFRSKNKTDDTVKMFVAYGSMQSSVSLNRKKVDICSLIKITWFSSAIVVLIIPWLNTRSVTYGVYLVVFFIFILFYLVCACIYLSFNPLFTVYRHYSIHTHVSIKTHVKHAPDAQI